MLPWYERYRLITLSRPVTSRAMRIAFSLASAPPLVKNTFSNPSGARSVMSRAAFARVSFANGGAAVASVSSCSRMPSSSLGCWCPMFVKTSWLAKSR